MRTRHYRLGNEMVTIVYPDDGESFRFSEDVAVLDDDGNVVYHTYDKEEDVYWFQADKPKPAARKGAGVLRIVSKIQESE